MLSIFEELFLLSLNEEKGSTLPFAKKTLPHMLAGGILAELAFQGKICSNEKHRLELLDASLTGDEILDETIIEIQASEKLRKLAYWVSQLSSRPKKLRERIGERLVAKNLLVHEDRRYFWRSSSEDNGLMAPTKFEIKNPLRASILSTTDESNPRCLALLNMASAGGLLNLIFTQDELSIAEHRIHEKVLRYALEYSAMDTIEEIEQAILTSLEDDID